MASSKALLLTILLGSTSNIAQGQTCNIKTNGRCSWTKCFAWRGPTTCVGGTALLPFQKACQCTPGHCTSPDGEVCWPETPSNLFKVGDAVNARDSKDGVWMRGKVTSLEPSFEVQPDGFSKSFAWYEVVMAPAQYKNGDVVDAKDNGGEWKLGQVTSVSPLRVQPIGWTTSFAFAHVRPQAWQKVQAMAAANQKKAQEQLRDAAKKAVDTATSTQQRAEASVATAMAKAQDAAAKQRSSDEAAAKATALAVVNSKKVDEQAALESEAQDATNKKLAADQALRQANKVAADTAAKAQSDSTASAKAQTNLQQSKAIFQATVKQEQEEANVAADSQKQADDARNAGNDPLAHAMDAAVKQTRVAQQATHKLAQELRSKVPPAGKISEAMDAAFLNSKHIAEDKKAIAEGLAHEQVSQAAEATQLAQKAALSKEAADKSGAAKRQGEQTAALLKQTAAQAAAVQKTAENIAQQTKQEAMHMTDVAEVAEAKSQQAEQAWPLKTAVDLYEVPAVPYQGNFMLLAIAGLGAAAIITAMLWQGRRVGGSVVMPESLLG